MNSRLISMKTKLPFLLCLLPFLGFADPPAKPDANQRITDLKKFTIHPMEEKVKHFERKEKWLDEECLPTIDRRLNALEEKLAAFETNAVIRVEPASVQHGNLSYLWIVIAFSLLLGIIGCLRHPGSARKTISPESTDPEMPKCPRCGKEHDPSDTVCKNCKTQF